MRSPHSSFGRRLLIAGAAALAAVLGLATPALSTLTASVVAQIQATYRGANDLGAPVYTLTTALQPALSLSTGTSTNQVNVLFADTRTVAASSSETLDLYGGLTDPLGATINLATAKVILIKAAAANTNNVVIGNAAAPAALGFGAGTQTWAVPPGGVFLVAAPAAGWGVTNTSADGLKIANSSSGSGVTYDIIVLGTQ